jgi:hypothetical protein
MQIGLILHHDIQIRPLLFALAKLPTNPAKPQLHCRSRPIHPIRKGISPEDDVMAGFLGEGQGGAHKGGGLLAGRLLFLFGLLFFVLPTEAGFEVE